MNPPSGLSKQSSASNISDGGSATGDLVKSCLNELSHRLPIFSDPFPLTLKTTAPQLQHNIDTVRQHRPLQRTFALINETRLDAKTADDSAFDDVFSEQIDSQNDSKRDVGALLNVHFFSRDPASPRDEIARSRSQSTSAVQHQAQDPSDSVKTLRKNDSMPSLTVGDRLYANFFSNKARREGSDLSGLNSVRHYLSAENSRENSPTVLQRSPRMQVQRPVSNGLHQLPVRSFSSDQPIYNLSAIESRNRYLGPLPDLVNSSLNYYGRQNNEETEEVSGTSANYDLPTNLTNEPVQKSYYNTDTTTRSSEMPLSKLSSKKSISAVPRFVVSPPPPPPPPPPPTVSNGTASMSTVNHSKTPKPEFPNGNTGSGTNTYWKIDDSDDSLKRPRTPIYKKNPANFRSNKPLTTKTKNGVTPVATSGRKPPAVPPDLSSYGVANVARSDISVNNASSVASTINNSKSILNSKARNELAASEARIYDSIDKNDTSKRGTRTSSNDTERPSRGVQRSRRPPRIQIDTSYNEIVEFGENERAVDTGGLIDDHSINQPVNRRQNGSSIEMCEINLNNSPTSLTVSTSSLATKPIIFKTEDSSDSILPKNQPKKKRSKHRKEVDTREAGKVRWPGAGPPKLSTTSDSSAGGEQSSPQDSVGAAQPDSTQGSHSPDEEAAFKKRIIRKLSSVPSYFKQSSKH